MNTNRKAPNPLTAVRFEPDLLELVRAEARDRDRSQAYVVNEILRAHYAAKGKAKPKSKPLAD